MSKLKMESRFGEILVPTAWRVSVIVRQKLSNTADIPEDCPDTYARNKKVDNSEKENLMKREKIACNCKNITYGMIEDAIKNGADSYEEVEKQLRFGTGCGKCKEYIQYLIRDLLAER